MVRPSVRRHSDPAVVRQVWAAIAYVRAQKQIANADRIARYMRRAHGTLDVPALLERATEDGLLDCYTLVTSKGAHTGTEQQGYRLPETDAQQMGVDKGDHDWYCFHCHQPGQVLACSECWRVYHTGCTEEPWGASVVDYICSVCMSLKKKPPIKRKELNRLLHYTINRLKEKARELHCFATADNGWLVARFAFRVVDLNTMEARTAAADYEFTQQFYVDARNLLHNTFVCYGDSGPASELAKIMIRDCKYDLDEINQCKDCYFYSNAKPRDWFCQPCSPAHELVLAKQKGFSYWPAKVIKVTPEGYDVRFFAGWHQRAIIAEMYVKAIDTDIRSLGIKRTASFVRASEELRRHRDLLAAAAATADTQPLSPEGSTSGGGGGGGDGETAAVCTPITEPTVRHKKFRKRPKYEEVFEEEEEEEEQEQEEEEEEEEEEDRDEASGPGEEDGAGGPRKDGTGGGPKGEVAGRGPPRREEEASGTRNETGDSSQPATGRRRRKRRRREEEAGGSRREEVISSSSPPLPPAAASLAMTPEDANVVTSSQDNVSVCARVVSTADVAVQTTRKLAGRQKSVQTDVVAAAETGGGGGCGCDAKYNRIFSDFKERLATDHAKERDESLRKLEERLRADFELDKGKAVSRALANVQRETERARRQAGERSGDELRDEMARLAAKHRSDVSASKKKQWCYNCEEEAMYHCCWNTSYCSIKCQQEHWHREHKRMCRRKRT